MAVPSIQFCSLCQEDDISNRAIILCTECGDFLCEDCSRHHSRFKSTKNHKTLGIDDYHKLPAFVKSISDRCNEHDERCDIYCSFHQIPCCVKCIKDIHQTCREMRPLCEALENIKSSAPVSQIESDFKILLDSFSQIEVHVSKHLWDMSPMNEALQDLKTLRSSITSHFDALEKEVLEKITEEKAKMQNKGFEIKTVLEAKRNRIINAQDDLSIMTLSATDYQFLIGLNKLQSLVAEEKKYLTDLQAGTELDASNVTFTVSPALASLVNSSRSFGNIAVVSVPSHVNITFGNANNAQLNVPPVQSMKTVHSINISDKRMISLVPDIKPMSITGCLILPNENLLFVDNKNGRLMLHDRAGTFIKNVIYFAGSPVDVVYVRGNIVAITLAEDRAVSFVDTEKNIEVKRITVRGKCNGITVENDMLFVRLSENDVVLKLDLEGNVIRQVRIQGKYHQDIAVFQTSIYCANANQNKLYCYNSVGKLLWKYSNCQHVSPIVIAIDRNGFIYAACKGSNTIMLVSPNGRESHILLSAEDGLEVPTALSIDRRRSKLLICNKFNGKAFLYNIT